jgi:hypothetical protein
MPKRVRSSDTVAGAAQAFIDAAKGLAEPPKHVTLRPQDRPYWDAIVANKPRDEWLEVQLVAAAQLARTQADLEEWSAQMEREEPVVFVAPNATPRPNPLLVVIEQATRRQLALMRALGLVSTDDPADAKKRQNTLKAARKIREQLASESLIAI